MELISVIVPVYNVEKYLVRCVDSIRNQTYTNLEIILVDDGSPDSCPQICDGLAQQDSRIFVVHKQNGGLGFARNTGLDVANGVYVTFIDSDDWIGCDHIENLYQAIIDQHADVAIGAHISVDANGTEQLHSVNLSKRLYNRTEIMSQILLPLIGPDAEYPDDVQVNSSSCMNLYRMEIIRANRLGFISEKQAVGEDLYFNIDFLYYAERLVVSDENGYYYYENGASISRKYDPKRFCRTLNCYKVLSERVENYGLRDLTYNRVERTFLMKVRVAIRLIVLSDMTYIQKCQELKKVLGCDVIRQVLHVYPIEKYVPGLRLLSWLMRSRSVFGVYWLMWFRETAKQNRFMKELMKKFGIGK